MKPKRLGRGLTGLIKGTGEEAVIADAPPPRGGVAPPELAVRSQTAAPQLAQIAPDAGARPTPRESVQQISVEQVQPNPYQPRKEFDSEALEELAASIRRHGLIQAITVRIATRGYEIIAGERRWRAARLAGLASVPAVVRPASDEEMRLLALVENLQREDLNAIEKAQALRSIMANLEVGQEEVAARIGKARATVANLLRLLELPQAIQDLVAGGRLSGAHARALLRARTAERRLALAVRAVEEGLSVRELERLTAEEVQGRGLKTATPVREANAFLSDVAERLRQATGTKVLVRGRGKGGGVIEIPFHDAAELDRLLEKLDA